MPPPSRPTLSLTRDSTTAFTATVSGGDAGVTNTLYYRKTGATSDTLGPSRVGNGSFAQVDELDIHGHYTAFVVSSDGSSYSLPGYAWVALNSTNTLTAGIHERFNSLPALGTAITGGLWTGEVPEGTAPPYAWLDVPYMNIEPLFENAECQLEAGRFVVSIFAIGAEATESCALVFRSGFDYEIIPFPVGSSTICIQLMPKTQRLRCENLRWRNSQLMWRATLVYHVLVSRPR